MLKHLLLGVALLLPSTVQAATVTPISVSSTLEEANAVSWTIEGFFLRYKIRKLASDLKIKMTDDEVDELAHSISIASELSEIDSELLLAIAAVESQLCHKKWLKGDGGASMGCMQIYTPVWGKILTKANVSKKDLFDTRTNIVIGSLILREKINKYGYENGILRYNGNGEAAKQYLIKVQKLYKRID